jgi:hypothetical protein
MAGVGGLGQAKVTSGVAKHIVIIFSHYLRVEIIKITPTKTEFIFHHFQSTQGARHDIQNWSG